MSNETYVYYDVYNHTNALGLESYALPFCQFRFIPKIDALELSGVLSNTKALWVFGDGTTSQSVSATHAYSQPGEYRVQSFFYNADGIPYANTYSRIVTVKNYVEDAVNIRVSDLQITDGMKLSAGRISSQIFVTRTNSYQTYTPDKAYTIKPYAVGDGISTSYFEGASALLYSHLEKYHAFYTREIARTGDTEYVEANVIDIPSTLLYCKLSNNDVILTTATDADGFFCGTSGVKAALFKEDVPCDRVDLLFGFETSVFGVNSPSVGLSCEVVRNLDRDTVSVTSNGIDGEGVVVDTFQLTANKFAGTKIAFVAKIKDADWYTNTDVSVLGGSVSIIDVDTNLTIPTEYYIQEYDDVRHFLKGYVIPEHSVSRAQVRVAVSLDGEDDDLIGYSSEFTIINTQYTYEIAKQGEYFDMTASYKELGFQDLFNGQNVLFDDFIGSIVGNISSGPNTIGKKVYEKITNFVDNNANIETCNVAQLVSLLESVGDENILFEKSNFNFPAALKRLVDILSIKHSKLFGAANNFDLDFYNFGNSQEFQGKNLGRRIDTLNYTVSANVPIVALEKYSSTFRKLDTYRPLSAVSIQQQLSSHPTVLTYPLSSYNEDWSWHLVLNDGYVVTDLPKYYTFFEFIPNGTTIIRDSVINFDDFNNTIPSTLSSYSTWVADNGIIDTMIASQLYQGLNLIGYTDEPDIVDGPPDG